VTPIEAIQYALNLPTSVVICGIDSMEILDQAIEAALSLSLFSEDNLKALLAKTAKRSSWQLEPFKTSSIYDAQQRIHRGSGDEPSSTASLHAVEIAAITRTAKLSEAGRQLVRLMCFGQAVRNNAVRGSNENQPYMGSGHLKS